MQPQVSGKVGSLVGWVGGWCLTVVPSTPPCKMLLTAETRTESPEQFNSQLWRIQEENAEIQKTQVELLRRMTAPVPKPPVFDKTS